MTRDSEEVYPLKLTATQRLAFRATRVRRKLMDRIKAAPEGTQIVGFTRKELDHLQEEVGTSTRYAPSPEKEHLVSVHKKLVSLLDSLSEEPAAPKRKRPTDSAELLFQFKVTLLDIKPPIWRRIQIEDGTLENLHLAIQGAFGWWNYHLHQFIIDRKRFGPLPDDGFDFGLDMADETQVRLSEVLPKSGRRTRWEYEYDFGDGWRHEILFEGYPPREKRRRYPLCLEGARACPPEDSGGPWGYAGYLLAMADPDHERHDELMEWRGPFDSESFDPKKATKQMREWNP